MKKIQSIAIGVVLSISIILLPSCDNRTREKNTVIIPSENDIQTLDPTSLSDPYTSRIVWQMYEGLIGLDNTGNPHPLIAESWKSNEDNTVWTFKIRPNIYFHKSGLFKTKDSTRAVNANDVLFTYTKFAKGFGSFVFSGLVAGFDDYLKNKSQSISGFSTLDPMTFQIHLVKSDPSFIYRITSPYLSIIPHEAIENNAEAFGKSVCVGTGPYQFERRTATEVYLKKNTGYWAKVNGNLDRIVFRVEKNPQLRITQFENGNYQLVQLPLNLIPNYVTNNKLNKKSEDKYSLYSTTTFNIHYMGIDCKIIPDIHLRRAIAFAINKNAIVKNLLNDQAVLANSPILPGMQGYKSPTIPEYNLDSAKAELKKSSYKGSSIKLFVSDAPNDEQVGQIIQDNLKKINIKIELIKLDFNTLISRLFSKERPEMFLMFSEWIYSAPELIIDSYNSKNFPNPNIFAYSNKKVDLLISQISKMKNRSDVNNQCFNIESIALSEVPAVWLYHQKSVFLLNKNLKSFSINAHNYWDLADAYLE